MIPIDVTFQGLDVSEALRDNILDHAHKLQQFAPDLLSCHAVVRLAEGRHHHGNRFVVHVHVTLPGAELDAGHPTRDGHAHEDPYVAARDTFDAIRRQLEDYERRRRGKVKQHVAPARARVLDIDGERGVGTLLTADDREIPFHRNAVVEDRFDQLRPGARVRFSEAPGEDGPWASTVHPDRRRSRSRQNQDEEE